MFPCATRDVLYFPCLEGGHLFLFQFFEGQTNLDQKPSGMRQNNRLRAIIGLRNTVGKKSIFDERTVRIQGMTVYAVRIPF